MSTELLLILFTVVPVYRIDSADSTMDMERISEDVFYSLKKKKIVIKFDTKTRDVITDQRLTCMLMAILKLSPKVICSISNSLNSTSSICFSSKSYISCAIGTTLIAFLTAILSSGESKTIGRHARVILCSVRLRYIIIIL